MSTTTYVDLVLDSYEAVDEELRYLGEELAIADAIHDENLLELE